MSSSQYSESSGIATRKDLSSREIQIVDLCVLGMTNEGIAQALSISLGTVNTYWLRIKRKVGGSCRADTIARIVKQRAEGSLREANEEKQRLAEMVAQCEQNVIELRPALALLRLAMGQIHDLIWETDPDLTIQIVETGGLSNSSRAVPIETGKTIYEIFGTEDNSHPAIAAHIAALRGAETDVQLIGELKDFSLMVSPLPSDCDESLGCISVLSATN